MTVDEADKINDLYKQLDALTVENATLKEHVQHNHSELLERLKSIEQKLDGRVKK
jgi:hypothetical protein